MQHKPTSYITVDRENPSLAVRVTGKTIADTYEIACDILLMGELYTTVYATFDASKIDFSDAMETAEFDTWVEVGQIFHLA